MHRRRPFHRGLLALAGIAALALPTLSRAATLHVDAPNGGERLRSLVPFDIRWTTDAPGGNVRIAFFDHLGTRYTPDVLAPNTGTLAWKAPWLTANPLRVRVSLEADSTVRDSSDAMFTMCPTLGAPAGVSVPWAKDLELADVDADGDLDLLLSIDDFDHSLDGVAFAKGRGDGGFDPPVRSFVPLLPGNPDRIEVADVDGDGRVDVVMALGSWWGVMHGNGTGATGDGTFSPGATGDVGLAISNLALVDLDLDGARDLVLTHQAVDSISVLRGGGGAGHGDGTFGAPARLAAADQPFDIATADFDENGAPDVAVGAGPFAGTTVYLGQTSGGAPTGVLLPGVTYAVATAAQSAVVAADMDLDGILDLVRTNGSHLMLQRGNGAAGVGDGTFAPAIQVDGGGFGSNARVADLNDDGRPDVVTALFGVSLWLGNGTGAPFTAGGTVSSASPIHRFELADIDHDGRLDAVTFAPAASQPAAYAVLMGDCAPEPPGSVRVLSPNTDVRLHVGPGNTFPLRWTKSASTVAVDVQLSRDGGAQWETVASAFTDTTIAWTIAGPSTEQALLRVTDVARPARTDTSDEPFAICGPMALAPAILAGNDANAIVLADVDRDGDPDLVTSGLGLKTQFGDGAGGFGAPVLSLTGVTVGDIEPDDIDGDGILDLIAVRGFFLESERGLGANGTGNGLFNVLVRNTLPRSGRALAVGDFDEDGVTDAAVGSFSDSTVMIMLGAGANGVGTGAFTLGSSFRVPLTVRDVVAADFDDDGILDLAVSSHAGGAGFVSVARGTGAAGHGDGGFALPVSFAAGTRPGPLVAADFDADLVLDLAVGNDTPQVTVLRGLGSPGGWNGSFALQGSYASSVAAVDLAAGDFNGDGDHDLAALGSTGVLSLLGGTHQGGPASAWFAPMEIDTLMPPFAAELAAIDLNADATPDLVASLGANDRVQLLRAGCPVQFAPAFLPITSVAGATWPLGSEQTIQWAPLFTDLVHLEVSRDGGAHWERVVSRVHGVPFAFPPYSARSYAWTVTGPPTGHARLRVVDALCPTRLAEWPGEFGIGQPPAGAGDADVRAAAFAIAGRNPSAGGHAFALALPEAADVRVEVFDAAGRRVRVVAHAAFPAGRHALAWDGRDAAGRVRAAGVYFARARWAGFDRVLRVVRTL